MYLVLLIHAVSKCDHSNESYSAAFSGSTVYYPVRDVSWIKSLSVRVWVNHQTYWVLCGWNSEEQPFRGTFFSHTLIWYCYTQYFFIRITSLNLNWKGWYIPNQNCCIENWYAIVRFKTSLNIWLRLQKMVPSNVTYAQNCVPLFESRKSWNTNSTLKDQ